ncbi:hypothetical protein CRUP_003155, partial [Coryphaenoides rupestris]
MTAMLRCLRKTTEQRTRIMRNSVIPWNIWRWKRTSCGSQLCVNNTDAACRCVSARGHSVSIAAGDVNEQIATALLRLQEDMADLLHRLHTLEVLTVSQ